MKALLNQNTIVSVGQPKDETTLEENGEFHIMGNRKYKV
jgi:hypothetical protein